MERYEKIRVIGQGAFGKVFLVKRVTDSRQVVIKQMPVDDLGKEERLVALNEVRILSMLQHPNIIAYFDNFVDEKSLMIVMEYAPGGTLYEFIQERNNVLLDEDHILLFFVQLLVAIEHIHHLNILHRDLKPQNVMMNRKRNILKIGDFGISKVLSTKITSAQTVVGTPCYISPEICEGKLYATKSDLWALGCILYELTTLRKAFEGPNLPALVLKIMQASAVLDPVDPRFSIGLKDLIQSLLQRQPDDRPSVHQVMATPVLINAHMNLATDVGRLPCSKLDAQTSLPINCTRMNSKCQLSEHTFVVEPYRPPGGQKIIKSPKPLVYLWGGGVTTLMKLDPPVGLLDSKIASVTCGRTQKSAVTDDGKIIYWEVSAGSLGTTRLTMAGKGGGGRPRKRDPLQFEPVLIGGLKTTSIKKVACGDMFNACLTDKGILMTFGSGANGALGHGDTKDAKEPRLVKAMLEFETTEVACGSYHVIAITSEGSVYTWGCGDRGQLGLGSTEQHHTPQRVWLPANADVPVHACCGADCSMIVTNSGQVFATGANRQNKLTLDNMDAPEPNQDSSNTAATNTTVPPPQTDSGTPAILQMLKNQSKMSQSFYIASMQQKDDKTHGVGAIGGMTLGAPSSALTLGLGGGRGSSPAGGGERVSKPKWMVSEVSRFTMTGSELVRERNIISASMGINHVALLTASGEVLTSGDNRYGQLGYRKATPTPPSDHTHSPSHKERLPQVVMSLQDKEVTKTECGDFFCVACCKDGSVYSWGRGHGGRLGRDVEEDVYEPLKVSFEFPSHEVQSLSCCHSVTMLLTVPQS